MPVKTLITKEMHKELSYTFMSHHQTAGQNRNVKVANKSFENVAEYLGTRQQLKIVITKNLKAD
jgi:hypothetical protein